eukprot:TCONS_00016022-protein
MDSAHCDERNLAHSATGRIVTNKVDNSAVEIAKLKEDHDKQIQKLTFENRIKTLELEKEMSKQDNEQKMKILQLEKDNQSLSHEFEFMKLKTSHEMEAKKVVVDRVMEREMLKQQNEFQNRLSEKDKALLEKDNELTAKENECKTKINEMEKSFHAKEYEYQTKMAAKENELTSKMKHIEHTNTVKFLEMEKEKELIIQSLRHKIEMLEASKIKELPKEFKPEVLPSSKSKDSPVLKQEHLSILQPENLKQTRHSIAITEDKILWGVKKYFIGIKTESDLFTSYENWYEALSSLLENEVQKFVKQGKRRYCFIRKEMSDDYISTLFLITKRKHDGEINGPNTLSVEYPNRADLKNARSFLLHPEQRNQCIQFTTFNCFHEDCEYWRFSNVLKNHYFGEKKSVIVFFYL